MALPALLAALLLLLLAGASPAAAAGRGASRTLLAEAGGSSDGSSGSGGSVESAVAPSVKRVTWKVTYDVAAPDCWERPVILVNGELSPTLEVEQGQILEVGGVGRRGMGCGCGGMAWHGGDCGGVEGWGPRWGVEQGQILEVGVNRQGGAVTQSKEMAYLRFLLLLPALLCLQLTLVNQIPQRWPTVHEGTSIHFHGFSMRGVPW